MKRKSGEYRNYDMYLKYKLTPEDYNVIFNNQNGCCAICGEHQSKFKRNFAVDHDHETKEIRGLLCSKCNLMIGYANDNVEILNKAIKYLHKVI